MRRALLAAVTVVAAMSGVALATPASAATPAASKPCLTPTFPGLNTIQVCLPIGVS